MIITSLRLNAIEAVTSDVMKAQGKSKVEPSNLAILLLFSLASQRRRQIFVERFETCVLNFVLVSVGKNFHHSSTISSARKRIKEEEKETSNMESNLQLISVS